MSLVKSLGTTRWATIAENLNKQCPGVERNGKQCRTRCVRLSRTPLRCVGDRGGVVLLGQCHNAWRTLTQRVVCTTPSGGSTTWTPAFGRTLGALTKRRSSTTRRSASATSGRRLRSCCRDGEWLLVSWSLPVVGLPLLCVAVVVSYSTDNAVKNHWYSTMRRSMRRIAKKLKQQQAVSQKNKQRAAAAHAARVAAAAGTHAAAAALSSTDASASASAAASYDATDPGAYVGRGVCWAVCAGVVLTCDARFFAASPMSCKT